MRLPPLATLAALAACTGAATPAKAPEVAAPAAQAAQPALAAARQGPPLVVLVVVDQLAQAHLDRLAGKLPGAFGRLTGPEAWQAVGVYAHSATETCPGHATIATGASPSVHGIVGNSFVLNGRMAYCLDAGPLPVQSIGDVVTAAGGKVASLSIKDRGATLVGGNKPTLVAWMNRRTGVEQTGTYAAPQPLQPPLVPTSDWVGWVTTPWTLANPQLVASLGIPDDQPHESDPGIGRTFPHTAPSASAGPAGVANLLMATPAGGEYLTAAALAAVDRAELGQDATPDLLSVSYSHFDGIGHTFTPASQESVDALIRLDQQLARLFAGLDERVGAGAWTVVLTADHGIPMQVPTYVDLEPLTLAIASELAGADLPPLAGRAGTAVYLNPGLPPDQRAASLAAVTRAAASVPGIAHVVDLANPTGPFAQAFVENRFEGRNPDFEIVLQEGAITSSSGRASGTTHGSPYPYDTRVPVLAWGQGIQPGQGGEVDMRDVAPTLAALLGAPPPKQATGTPLTAALAEAP